MSPRILNVFQLGEALRAERKALGLSQAALASRMDFRRQTVAGLESGKNVSLFTLMAALAALGKGLKVVDSRPSLDEINELLERPDEN